MSLFKTIFPPYSNQEKVGWFWLEGMLKTASIHGLTQELEDEIKMQFERVLRMFRDLEKKEIEGGKNGT